MFEVTSNPQLLSVSFLQVYIKVASKYCWYLFLCEFGYYNNFLCFLFSLKVNLVTMQIHIFAKSQENRSTKLDTRKEKNETLERKSIFFVRNVIIFKYFLCEIERVFIIKCVLYQFLLFFSIFFVRKVIISSSFMVVTMHLGLRNKVISNPSKFSPIE